MTEAEPDIILEAETEPDIILEQGKNRGAIFFMKDKIIIIQGRDGNKKFSRIVLLYEAIGASFLAYDDDDDEQLIKILGCLIDDGWAMYRNPDAIESLVIWEPYLPEIKKIFCRKRNNT